MEVIEYWEKDQEIYVQYDNGEIGRVNYGWWNGCRSCGAHEDEISDIQSEQGYVAACEYAMEHLTEPRYEQGNYLCKDCYEAENED